MTIEEHPLEPFLPVNAKILFLGSFPPPKARWSMGFFYPNWINDFWRIQGLIHFGDKSYFEKTPNPLRSAMPLRSQGQKKGGYEDSPKTIKAFDKERIVAFCEEKGIALFDTARKVRRLKDNADDNFLEIVEGTNVFALLEQIPECRTIVTTGGKASEELQAYFLKKGIEVKIPKVGEYVIVNDNDDDTLRYDDKQTLRWWRMPSSSRAYPMKLEKKAEYYRRLSL